MTDFTGSDLRNKWGTVLLSHDQQLAGPLVAVSQLCTHVYICANRVSRIALLIAGLVVQTITNMRAYNNGLLTTVRSIIHSWPFNTSGKRTHINFHSLGGRVYVYLQSLSHGVAVQRRHQLVQTVEETSLGGSSLTEANSFTFGSFGDAFCHACRQPEVIA